MSNPGYIYVLINPSMHGLVKIGKTTRDPAGRAKELSGATGVPTPFVLAYDLYFHDCSAAEEFVHALLEKKRHRISSNREFFNASLSDVIKAVTEAERVLSSSLPAVEKPAVEEDNLPTARMPWEEVLELADDSYFGNGLTIQDYAEASRLYNQAARLGSSYACIALGNMARFGTGCKEDHAAAVEFFKQGTRLGDDRCWAEMADLFSFRGEVENAIKCWTRYFGSKGFREDKPTDSSGFNRLWYANRYLLEVQMGVTPMNFKNELSTIKDELLEKATDDLNRAKDYLARESPEKRTIYLGQVTYCEKCLDTVSRALGI
jgi:tetratricopeptide (TPR) repeat protein